VNAYGLERRLALATTLIAIGAETVAVPFIIRCLAVSRGLSKPERLSRQSL